MKARVIKAAMHQIVKYPFVQVVVESGSIHKGDTARVEDNPNLKVVFHSIELAKYTSDELKKLPLGVAIWILEPVAFDITLLEGKVLVDYLA
jgi:hypothetical protein